MDIAKLARVGVVKKYAVDEVFFQEGDPGNEMYIILKGRVGVYLNSIDGFQYQVAQLKSGDFFGEMSLLEFMPRSATIQALEETVAIILDQNNFAEVISREPELAYRIMKGMSSRLRQLNDEILELKRGALSSSEESDFPPARPAREEHPAAVSSATAGSPTGQTAASSPAVNKAYALTAPASDENFLFEKDTSCPVCDKSFPTKMTRSSRLRLQSIDPDLRQHFVDFEPSWYMVWVCPHCSYANFNFEFKQVSEENKKYILKESDRLKKEFPVSFSTPRKIEEVLMAYYLTLHILNSAKKPDVTKIAKVWLRLSWLYNDIQDEDNYKEATSKALEYFKESYYNGNRNTSAEQEQRLTLLLGELSLRMGAYEEAVTFFRNSIMRKGGNATINRQAEDRIQEVKSRLEKQGSE